MIEPLAVDLLMYLKYNFGFLDEVEIVDTLALVDRYSPADSQRVALWRNYVTEKMEVDTNR